MCLLVHLDCVVLVDSITILCVSCDIFIFSTSSTLLSMITVRECSEPVDFILKGFLFQLCENLEDLNFFFISLASTSLLKVYPSPCVVKLLLNKSQFSNVIASTFSLKLQMGMNGLIFIYNHNISYTAHINLQYFILSLTLLSVLFFSVYPYFVSIVLYLLSM